MEDVELLPLLLQGHLRSESQLRDAARVDVGRARVLAGSSDAETEGGKGPERTAGSRRAAWQ